MATGRQAAGLAQMVGHAVLAARPAEAFGQGRDSVRSGRRSSDQDGRAVAGDGLAQGRRQGVDGAALEAVAGQHRLAAHRLVAEGQGDGLQRLAGEPLDRMSVQATSKPTLAGRRGATATPSASSAGTQAPSEPSRGQLAPPRARTRRVGGFDPFAVGRLERQRPVAPAGPARAGAELDAEPVQPAPARPAAGARPSWPGGRPGRWSRRRSAGPDPRPRRSGRPARRRRASARPGRRASRSAPRKASCGSEWVRFSPPRPAIRSLRADRGHPLVDDDARARPGQASRRPSGRRGRRR